MPRSKNDSGSEHSAVVDDVHAVRRRVVKACQRCRLKKCKCDGSTPCTRCKSDDAICAYGKHKKSDKIIFRKGYVQMLERQHIQLIAGLQELYRRTLNGQGWDGPALDPVNYGQPLTHKILEGLGVLCTDEWDDTEGPDGMSSWQSFEQQSQEGSGIIHEESGTASPASTTGFSPVSTAAAAFPRSTIMAKRRSKYEASIPPIRQTLSMAPLPAFRPHTSDYNALPHSNDSGFASEPGYYNAELHLQIPPPMAPFNNGLSGNDSLPYGNMDWNLSTDDMFDVSGNQGGLPLSAIG